MSQTSCSLQCVPPAQVLMMHPAQNINGNVVPILMSSPPLLFGSCRGSRSGLSLSKLPFSTVCIFIKYFLNQISPLMSPKQSLQKTLVGLLLERNWQNTTNALAKQKKKQKTKNNNNKLQLQMLPLTPHPTPLPQLPSQPQ